MPWQVFIAKSHKLADGIVLYIPSEPLSSFHAFDPGFDATFDADSMLDERGSYKVPSLQVCDKRRRYSQCRSWDILALRALLATSDATSDCAVDIVKGQACDGDASGWCASGKAVLVILLDDNTGDIEN